MEHEFLDEEAGYHLLDLNDSGRQRFLLGMIETYRDLTSLDEPDIFDISKDQKHTLNQLIHFTFKNWEEHKLLYAERHRLARDQSSPNKFVAKRGKKLKPPAYSFDCVNDICDEIKQQTQDGNASFDVRKNNGLHPDMDLSSKDRDKHIGFGFFTCPHKYTNP